MNYYFIFSKSLYVEVSEKEENISSFSHCKYTTASIYSEAYVVTTTKSLIAMTQIERTKCPRYIPKNSEDILEGGRI